MFIQKLSSNLESEWDHYVLKHPHSNCYHRRAWQRVAQSVYKLQTHFLIAKSKLDGEVQGILPLFQLDGLGLCKQLSNGLFGAYAPALVDNEEAMNALLHYSRDILALHKLKYLFIKTLDNAWPHPNSLEFREFTHWAIAILRLYPDPDRVWHELRDKIRNCIRKAMTFHLEIRTGPKQIEPFYDVLADNMHHKGSPIYGLSFIHKLVEEFGSSAEVITLWHRNQVISGALVLNHRDTTYVPFASSRPSSLFMCPNNLLYWEIIRRSCLKGMKTLDFGRSLKNSTQLAFKLGWGANLVSQPCYVFSANKRGFQFFDAKSSEISWFVNSWKHFPRIVVDSIGPHICRQLAGFL